MFDIVEPRIVVTGQAGFLGSHLCETLVERGAHVVCLDNFITGHTDNITYLFGRQRFKIVEHDVIESTVGPGRSTLASPASPVDYLHLLLQTLKVGALGTH